DALDEIVALAKIPKDCRSYFRDLVRGTVSDAAPRIKKLKPFSDDSIASKSKAVMHKAHTLLADLKTMEKGSHAGNALGIAGLSLRAAAMGRRLTIKHFIDQLELLVEVAEAAASISPFVRKVARSDARPAPREISASISLFSSCSTMLGQWA